MTLPSKERAQAVTYIGGRLPAVSPKLDNEKEEGQFVKTAELLLDCLGSSHYVDEEQSRSTTFKYQEAISIVARLQCFSI